MKKKQRKQFIVSTVAATLAVSTVAPSAAVQAEHVKDQADGQQATTQLIVKTTNIADVTKIAEKMDAVQVVEETDALTVLEVPVEDAETVTNALSKHENIEYVEENSTYTIAATNDAYAESQWNLKAINAEQAWDDLNNTALSEEDVVVAVLDTGVQADHEDLQGRILPGATFVDGQEETNATGADDQGHGTFVSGFIVANANNEVGIAGVTGNQPVKVLPVKVMSKNGSGTAVDIAEGIDYAVEQGVDVINMSLSGEYSETVEQAIERAAEKGIVVVAASGNGGGNADVSFPAASPNVISVAALAANDQHYTRSNVGETVDIAAPGAGVFSTSMTSEKYITGSGTSYATPHVAAAAALYKLKYPTASAVEIEEALKATAVDLGEAGWDDKTGFGKLDVAALLAGNVALKAFSMNVNADLLGTTDIQFAIADTSKVAAINVYANDVKIGTIDEPSNVASLQWDTTAMADGDVIIKAEAVDAHNEIVETITRTVSVMNDATSGYMFDVKTPSGTVAKAASVLLYEKEENEDGTYSYKELWSGRTSNDGVVRVPSNIGTDLKSLQVVVQGTFDAAEGNTWFMYNREVNDIGTVELSSEHTVPVQLTSTNINGEDVPNAEYFITMQDAEGVELTLPRKINKSADDQAPTVYIDQGTYNIYSHFKQDTNTYFLTESNTKVEQATTLQFDAKKAGEVAVTQAQQSKIENAVLYLYNKDVSNIFGSSEVLTGKRFFVTPGDYHYMVDAEVADLEGGDNWVYVFANNQQQASVKQGEKTEISVGGKLEISHFDVDQDSLRRYYTQRKLTYVERESPYDMYRSDGVVYSKHEFSDAYGNMLVGLRRGSIDSQDAIYQKDINSGETKEIGDNVEDTRITSIDFGDLYATYIFKNVDTGEVILNSAEKNKTNPANRSYYTYGFAVITAAKVKAGNYQVGVELEPTPLAPEGLSASFNTVMKNSARTLKLADENNALKATYVTIMSPVKDEDGDYTMETQFTSNSDSERSLAVPTNLHLSTEKDSNVAIIRYVTATGEFAYIFKKFTNIDELNTTIQIPDNMQKVDIKAYNDEEVLDGVSTKQWLIKQAVEIDGQTVYATANNLQNYKKDAVYLEPGTFTFEGNYVSLPNAELERKNYYFLHPEVTIDDSGSQEVKFNTKDLAKVTIAADTEGFTDVRGAMLYPYNKYSNSFTSTLRVGHEFYVPANVDMNLQVQLGYGDREDTNKIWNYFLSKGEQTFTPNEDVTWHVGGSFKANLQLEETNFKEGTVALNGHASIEDSYHNAITSVLVNQTSDYSISNDASIAYTLKNGEIVETTVDEDGHYTVAHSAAPPADVKSFKPVFTVYDANNNRLLNEADLAYYTDIHNITLDDVKAGTYTAELALAASPQGPITTTETFTVETSNPSTGGSDVEVPTTPPTDETDDNTATPEVKPTPPPAPTVPTIPVQPPTEGQEETQPDEQPEADQTTQQITKEDIANHEEVALVFDDVKVRIPTKQLAATDHTVNVQEQNGVLTFSVTTTDSNDAIVFDDYVELTFSTTKLSDETAIHMVRLLEDGTHASIPHTVKDGIVTLKVHQGGTFTIASKANAFNDIAKDGHAPYIEELAKRLIVQGKTANTFEPNSTSTRAQFAAIIARALDVASTGETTFTDTKGKWFEHDVQALVEAGIIKGTSPQTFTPNAAITRQQAAVMMMRLVNYLQIDTDVNTTPPAFTDFHKISAEGQQAVMTLQKLGVFSGKEDGSFDPNGQLTRSQMAKIIYKVLELGELL